MGEQQEIEKVHFYSEGVRLTGLMYYERRSGRRPGIAVCHGFGGLKEGTPPNIARRLASSHPSSPANHCAFGRI